MSETNGILCGYIHDGYTRDGYIAEVPRLYPALRFKYRPLVAQERAIVYDQIEKADVKTAELHGAQSIFARVASWDLKDSKGTTVKLSVESILRVQPQLEARVLSMVLGSQLSLPAKSRQVPNIRLNSPQWDTGSRDCPSCNLRKSL